jgi:hypothetical protein
MFEILSSGMFVIAGPRRPQPSWRGAVAGTGAHTSSSSLWQRASGTQGRVYLGRLQLWYIKPPRQDMTRIIEI